MNAPQPLVSVIPDKPPLLKPNLERIPPVIRAQARCVTGDLQWEPSISNWKKFPRIPGTRLSASIDRPEIRVTVDQAVEFVVANFHDFVWAALTGEPIMVDGRRYYLIAIDLDKCVTLDGKKIRLSKFAKRIVMLLAGHYCELSPSMMGLRWYILTDRLLQLRAVNPKEEVEGHSFEVKQQKAYASITGWPVGNQTKLLPESADALEAKLAPFFLSKKGTVANGACSAADLQIELRSVSPDELPEQVRTLIRGATSELGRLAHPDDLPIWLAGAGQPGRDDSADDLALCGFLVRNGVTDRQTLADTWRAYRYRSKLDRIDYLSRTLQVALNETTSAPICSETADSELDVSDHDHFLARLLAQRERGKLIYVTTEKTWLRYDGGHWMRCGGHEEEAAAKALLHAVKQMLVECLAQYGPDHHRTKSLMRVHTRISSINGVEAALTLARSESGMSVTSQSIFDADPYALSVKNGVIDLRTRKLKQRTPEMLISKEAGAVYDPLALCPTWDRFQLEICCGDTALVSWKQRIFGKALIGRVTEEKVYLLHGDGRNGKSTEGAVLAAIFRDYGVAASSSLLDAFATKTAGPRPELMALIGKRFAAINELRPHTVLDAHLLKVVASSDTITARGLYQSTTEFIPTHTLFIRTNDLFAVRETGLSVWRRLEVIPYDHVIPDTQVDHLLTDKLKVEASGILNWLLEGCSAYLQDPHATPPKRVLDATSHYRRDQDVFADFCDEHCKFSTVDTVDTDALYRRYVLWCEGNGLKPMSAKAVTLRMGKRGVQKIRANRSTSTGARGYLYSGVSLL